MRRAKVEDSGGRGLVKLLRDLFTSFGIPEELTSDGGPEFMSHEMQQFLKRYGVNHRVSSVGNPHSNQRAEVGVKAKLYLVILTLFNRFCHIVGDRDIEVKVIFCS